MSKFDRTASDIFYLVLDKGPLTLYSASTISTFPLGTIHRHFKEMKRAGEIKVYEETKNGRKKILYGPTVYGFISFYGIDDRIKQNIENYFLKWIERDEFLSDLKKEGFDSDAVASQPNKSKDLFHKYVHYFAGVEFKLEQLKDGIISIPREVSLFIGEALVAMNPEYMKIWKELYINCPGIKNNVDSYLNGTLTLYQQLQKNQSVIE